MIGSQSEPNPVNRWPLNQDAKKCILQAGEHPNPHYLYLVQLLSLGFEKGLDIPGQAQQFRGELKEAADQLYNPRMKPAQIMRWFLNNPNGEDQGEQNDTLRQELQKAKDWKEAAQSLMEWFYDRRAANDPYFRPAPSGRE